MARSKNALRGHFVQAYVPGVETPGEEWLEVGKYIETIEADNNEETEEMGFYDGDGTPEQDVVSVAVGYSLSGFYDPEDAAQQLIADLEFATGEGRKIWHKRVNAQKTKEWTGKATVSEIVVGGGDATAYEAFEANIRWDRKPEMTPIPAPAV